MAKVMPGCLPQSEPRGSSESSTSMGLPSWSRTWEMAHPPLICSNFFLNDGLNHSICQLAWSELNPVKQPKQEECGFWCPPSLPPATSVPKQAFDHAWVNR